MEQTIQAEATKLNFRVMSEASNFGYSISFSCKESTLNQNQLIESAEKYVLANYRVLACIGGGYTKKTLDDLKQARREGVSAFYKLDKSIMWDLILNITEGEIKWSNTEESSVRAKEVFGKRGDNLSECFPKAEIFEKLFKIQKDSLRLSNSSSHGDQVADPQYVETLLDLPQKIEELIIPSK